MTRVSCNENSENIVAVSLQTGQTHLLLVIASSQACASPGKHAFCAHKRDRLFVLTLPAHYDRRGNPFRSIRRKLRHPRSPRDRQRQAPWRINRGRRSRLLVGRIDGGSSVLTEDDAVDAVRTPGTVVLNPIRNPAHVVHRDRFLLRVCFRAPSDDREGRGRSRLLYTGRVSA